MSKTLKYLPEGADFAARDFDQQRVFAKAPVQHFARGGLVRSTLPVKNKSAGDPSTDPTSSDVQDTKQAETDYRRSGGYGFKKGGNVKKCKGGKVRKYAKGGPVKMAEGGQISRAVQAIAMVNPAVRKLVGDRMPQQAAASTRPSSVAPGIMGQMLQRQAAAAPEGAEAPPALQAGALRMGEAAGRHIAKQMQSPKGRQRIFGPGALANAGMAKGGGVKKKFGVGGYTGYSPEQDRPTGPSIGERLFQLPQDWQAWADPTYKFGKMFNPLHDVGYSLLGIRKNNSPIQDIRQGVALGKNISDKSWKMAKYGPSGLGFWPGTTYPGAPPPMGARGGPPMVNLKAGYMDKLQEDPVFRRAMGYKKGGSVRYQEGGGVDGEDEGPPADVEFGSAGCVVQGKSRGDGMKQCKPGAVRGYKEGGSVQSDVAQDKALVRKGVVQHERAMHKGQKPTALKLNAGGMVREGMQPVTMLNTGGKVRR